MIYNYKSFTSKNLEEMFRNLWPKLQKPKQMKLMVSQDSAEYIDASLSGDENKMQQIQDKITIKLDKASEESNERFISKYGRCNFYFINSLLPDQRWTITMYPDYVSLASWKYIEEDENLQQYNDDSYVVYFSKGKYGFKKDIAGGYLDPIIIEQDIKKARVLELIKTKPQS